MKKSSWFVLIMVLLLMMFVLSGCGGQSNDQPQEQGENEKTTWPEPGTTIEFSVEYSPGGGYDTYTRALAPYIEKYLPNGAKVSVVNKPGADGAIAAEYLYKSRPDGTKIQILSIPGLVVRQLVSQTNYDIENFTILGQVSSGYYVTAVRTESPFKSIDDLLKSNKEIKVGTAGMADTSAITAIIAYSKLGVDFKIIPHTGLQEATISALRGDVDVVHGPYSTILPMIKEGKLRVLLTYTKDRLEPETPIAAEIGFSELTGHIELKRPIVAAPGLDPEVAQVLKDAVWKAMSDPDFVKWGQETGNEIVPLNAEETQKSIDDLFAAYEQRIEMLQEYIQLKE